MRSLLYALTPALATAALAALAGCGMPSASAGGPDKKVDPCHPDFPAVTAPTVVPWDGSPLALTAQSTIILERDPQFPGTYTAYQVEYTIPSVPVAVRVPEGKLPTFLDQSVLASVGIRNPPPPPPPIVDEMIVLLHMSRGLHEGELAGEHQIGIY
jgi:hypothetical protein